MEFVEVPPLRFPEFTDEWKTYKVSDVLDFYSTNSLSWDQLEYSDGELPLYHMDVYRLDGDVKELNIDDYFDRGGVTIIEWADMIGDHLPEERLDINIKITGEDTRVFVLVPHGKRYEEICEAVL